MLGLLGRKGEPPTQLAAGDRVESVEQQRGDRAIRLGTMRRQFVLVGHQIDRGEELVGPQRTEPVVGFDHEPAQCVAATTEFDHDVAAEPGRGPTEPEMRSQARPPVVDEVRLPDDRHGVAVDVPNQPQ
jgi:hypothetical protein